MASTSGADSSPWLRPALKYLAVVVPSTLGLAVLLSSDVLVVKHYFSSHEAGEYAAVAALGRAVFWGATGVAAVLFPKLVTRGAHGLSGSPVIAVSLVFVVLGGLFGMTAVSLGSHWLLTLFAGPAYASAAVYLPGYALGMTLLGGVAVATAAHQTRGHGGFLAILIPLSLLEILALIGFHQSLSQVVMVLDISMAAGLVALMALYWLQDRASPKTANQSLIGSESTPTNLALDANP
jgi:O-antigen/teichoic acid export membrane protein